jgi:hypothetical protein
MDRIKSVVVAAAIVALLPVLAVAQKTSFDFEKSEDFTKFKTYALKDGTKIADPLVHNRIVSAIEAALAAKGLTKNDAKPDIVVVYHIAFDKKQDITAYSSGAGGYGAYGYRWGGGFSTTDVQVNEIVQGTLLIDVADSAKNQIVWRGMGVKEIDVQAKAEKRDKNVTAAVNKILKNFPPPVKK